MTQPDPIEALLARVHWRPLRDAMRVTGRRWTQTTEGGREVKFLPSADDLRAQARALLERLRASPGTKELREAGFVARHCCGYWGLAYEVAHASVEEGGEHAP